MKSFAEFIAEGTLNKSQYKELRQSLGYEIEKAFKPVVAALLSIPRDDRGADFDELYWGSPSDIQSFKFYGKKLAKFKNKSNMYYQLANGVYASFADRVAELDAMKDNVVSAVVTRAVVKEKKAVEVRKAVDDSGSMVRELEKFRKEYVKKAGDTADVQYENISKVLKDGGYDLEVVAPYPNTSMSRFQYTIAKERYALYSRLSDNGKPTSALKAKYRAENERAADFSFSAWVAKMVMKVGDPVIEANMTGNPWNGSVLTVKTNKGETQVWNTKMILNFSKYRTMFNQFPSTRKS